MIFSLHPSYYGYREDMIAVLYTAGFASSVVLGTFTGSLADIVGRKKIALMSLRTSLLRRTMLRYNYVFDKKDSSFLNIAFRGVVPNEV